MSESESQVSGHISNGIFYMNGHALLNLLNKFGKEIGCEALLII